MESTELACTDLDEQGTEGVVGAGAGSTENLRVGMWAAAGLRLLAAGR